MIRGPGRSEQLGTKVRAGPPFGHGLRVKDPPLRPKPNGSEEEKASRAVHGEKNQNAGRMPARRRRAALTWENGQHNIRDDA